MHLGKALAPKEEFKGRVKMKVCWGPVRNGNQVPQSKTGVCIERPPVRPSERGGTSFDHCLLGQGGMRSCGGLWSVICRRFGSCEGGFVECGV